MFVYEKKLQYPVKIKNPNPRLAAAIISQYGGPDGELGASLRYLSQRYSMPYPELKGLLTDIGTEEASWPPQFGMVFFQSVQQYGIPFAGSICTARRGTKPCCTACHVSRSMMDSW